MTLSLALISVALAPYQGTSDFGTDKELLEPFPRLTKDSRSRALAIRLMEGCVLPPNAGDDAEHIAIASIHRMEYLLSWNCAHLANEQMAKRIRLMCESEGYSCPILCTPEQLLERYENVHLP